MLQPLLRGWWRACSRRPSDLPARQCRTSRHLGDSDLRCQHSRRVGHASARLRQRCRTSCRSNGSGLRRFSTGCAAARVGGASRLGSRHRRGSRALAASAPALCTLAGPRRTRGGSSSGARCARVAAASSYGRMRPSRRCPSPPMMRRRRLRLHLPRTLHGRPRVPRSTHPCALLSL